MISIKIENACIDFPIYTSSNRSLKKQLICSATGGMISSNDAGLVTVRAINNLTLEIKEGDRVGLIGHNGSGKSTLLRLITGIYTPSKGSIKTRGKIGSLIDISLGIDPELTGRDNIFIRGRLLGIEAKRIKTLQEEIINFTDLGDFIDLPLKTYSSGMQMRLAFGISTCINPDILLMDEWLSVGDESFQQKAEVRLQNLIEKTKILVIASHSHELIKKVCNRVIRFEHGSASEIHEL